MRIARIAITVLAGTYDQGHVELPARSGGVELAACRR
jgi:hypothetical protein